MFLNSEQSLSTFSDSGNLKQCDYALNAAIASASTVACSSADGCVIMSHKKLKKLIVAESYSKVFTVCPTIGVSYSGRQPDFRIQLGIAQNICLEYFEVYQKCPSMEMFINEFSLKVQKYSQQSGNRPFGTLLIFIGEGCKCYKVDPTGSFSSEQVITTGLEYEKTKLFIQKRHGGLDDNLVTCLNALKEYAGCKLSADSISAGIFTKKTGLFRILKSSEIQELFDLLQTH